MKGCSRNKHTVARGSPRVLTGPHGSPRAVLPTPLPALKTTVLDSVLGHFFSEKTIADARSHTDVLLGSFLVSLVQRERHRIQFTSYEGILRASKTHTISEGVS